MTHSLLMALVKAPLTALAMALRRVPCSSLSRMLYSHEASPWNFTLKLPVTGTCDRAVRTASNDGALDAPKLTLVFSVDTVALPAEVPMATLSEAVTSPG